MVKKIFTLIMAVALIFCIYTACSKPLFKNYATNYQVYSLEKSSGKITLANDKTFAFNFTRYGEGITLSKSAVQKFGYTVDGILNDFNAKLKLKERLVKGTSYYAYSKDIKYVESVRGEKINLHIFVSQDGSISIGAPIIYGSF